MGTLESLSWVLAYCVTDGLTAVLAVEALAVAFATSRYLRS